MLQAKTRFSGWSVLIGCFILMVFPGGLIAYTPSLFMNPICTEIGLSVTAYSLTYTVSSVFGALSSALLVPLLSKDKLNMKLLMTAALVFAAGGFAGLSLCSELWQFIAMTCIYTIGFSMLTFVPVGMMISNWFINKQSLAMGIALAGGNIGGAIFSTVMADIIANQGWRFAYQLGGTLTFVFSIIAILFLCKRSPKEYGQEPLTATKINEDQPVQKVWLGVTQKFAMKTPAVYLMGLALLGTGIYASGITSHAVNYLIGGGWDIVAAGSVMSVFTLVGIAGNLLGGGMFAKVGLKKGIICAACCTVTAVVSLIFAASIPFMGYVFAAAMGLQIAMGALVPSMMVSAVFGVKGYSGIYGFVYVFFLVGCGISPTAVGFISDLAGYKIAWIAMLAIIVVVVLAYIKCLGYAKKFKEAYPD